MNHPSVTTPVTSSFHFHLWGPLRDFCFLYTNARIKCVISYLKRHAASIIRSLSSSPSGMSPERAGIQKDTLLFQINNINIFCSTVHPHLIQVYYSTCQTLAFQETSLKKNVLGQLPCFTEFALEQYRIHAYCLKPQEVWICWKIWYLLHDPPAYCNFPRLVTW